MKGILKGALVLAAVVLGALLLWTIAYSYQDRLSDRTLIAIVATDAARHNRGTIAYASADDLIAANPGCCIVRHSNHEWLQFPARLYEDGLSVVQMSYLIERTPKPKYYFHEAAIDADGRILDTRGIEEDRRERW